MMQKKKKVIHTGTLCYTLQGLDTLGSHTHKEAHARSLSL